MAAPLFSCRWALGQTNAFGIVLSSTLATTVLNSSVALLETDKSFRVDASFAAGGLGSLDGVAEATC